MDSSSSLTACPGCDLLLQDVMVPQGRKSYCPCCRTPLYKKKTNSITKVLAISTSGLLLYIPALFMPLLTLEAFGMNQNGSIYDAFLCFYQQKYYFVSVLVFLTSILFPLLKLSLLFSISLQLKIRLYSKSLPFLMRLVHHLDEWAMVEIYLIGLFIMIIKVRSIAIIYYDTGFFCFLFLALTTIAVNSALDSRHFWRRIETIKRLSGKRTLNEQ